MTDIFFDCDSTLTAIEGIDELAANRGKGEQIAALTNAAMNGALKLEDVYAERLRLLAPTRADVLAVLEAYKRAMVPDALDVILQLHQFGKRVFIVSGGLAEIVIPFGEWLGVPRERIFAVGLHFDEHGRYAGVQPSPLTTQTGKVEVIGRARTPGATAMLVGDGSSDLAAAGAVDLFVGYGGVVSRALVRQMADVFITVNSLQPVIDLARGRLPVSGAIVQAGGRWRLAPAT